MDENLVGYLLQALEPDAHREVDAYLRTHPEARRRLELLRQALQPLAADRDAPRPPKDLWLRALARVAEHKCRKLPQAPAVTPAQVAPPPRRRWRRADLAVAASILLCVGLLAPPMLGYVNRVARQRECANNLRGLGLGLLGYSANGPRADHGQERGEFPNPAKQKQPYNVAGFAVPLLRDAGYAQDVSVWCPAKGPAQPCAWNASELKAMPEQEFKDCTPRLSGCYAYALGYRASGRVAGYFRADETVPLMSDRPPEEPGTAANQDRNSPNHGGRGQNVLFTDGHVEFLTSRTHQGDDLFLNRNRHLAPGLDRRDAVLGASNVPLE